VRERVNTISDEGARLTHLWRAKRKRGGEAAPQGPRLRRDTCPPHHQHANFLAGRPLGEGFENLLREKTEKRANVVTRGCPGDKGEKSRLEGDEKSEDREVLSVFYRKIGPAPRIGSATVDNHETAVTERKKGMVEGLRRKRSEKIQI